MVDGHVTSGGGSSEYYGSLESLRLLLVLFLLTNKQTNKQNDGGEAEVLVEVE